MTTVLTRPNSDDVLAGWMTQQRGKTRRLSDAPRNTPTGGLRFAFYGRVSTEDFQDPATSRAWQRTAASEISAGRGVIVAEFVDVGCSRRRAWSARPQAAALLVELADPDRRFDAVIVGEYERAFSGDQFQHLAFLCERHGVQVWLPETSGPIDHQSPTHQALITLLGAQSTREVQRSRFRTMAAMQATSRSTCLTHRQALQKVTENAE